MTRRSGIPIPIVVTLPDAAWHDVTATVTEQMEAYGADPQAFYLVGVHARAGVYDPYLSFRAQNDNKAFKIPALVEWDNIGVFFQIGMTAIHLRSTNATGDIIEILAAPEVKNA